MRAEEENVDWKKLIPKALRNFHLSKTRNNSNCQNGGALRSIAVKPF